MSIVARLFVADANERRSSQRRPVGADATLRTGRAIPHDVVVQDLSVSGCQFASDDMFSDGTKISIGIASLGVHQARIVRQTGRLHGCEFFQPLTPAQVAMAGQVQTVHRTAFVTVDSHGHPEPDVGQYAGAARVGIVMGGAILTWIALGMVAMTLW